jgi:hypothetical protein
MQLRKSLAGKGINVTTHQKALVQFNNMSDK